MGSLKRDTLVSINFADNAFGPDGVKSFIDFVVCTVGNEELILGGKYYFESSER
jgi:hypothetical protein